VGVTRSFTSPAAVPDLPEATDVCVIGGGTVGLLAAHVLAEHGRRVTVLESGATHAAELRAGVRQLEGDRHNGITEARGFGLGGTSRLWGGQLWRWLPEEIAERPRLGLPAWPLAYDPDLLRAYRAVAALLPLTDRQRRLLTTGPVSGRRGRVVVRWLTCLPWRFRNFARIFRHTGGRSGFRVVEDVVVERLETADGVCTAVRYRDASGNSRLLRADRVVLAAGTLSNAALLSTLPTRSPWLGHGFMDHLTALAGRLEIVDRRRLRRAPPIAYRRGARFVARFLPDPGFTGERRLPAALAQIELERPPQLNALRAALRTLQRRGWSRELAALLPALVRGLPSVVAAAVWPVLTGREYIARGTSLGLWVSIEQLPAEENRLRVEDGRVDLHWRHTTDDVAALTEYAKHFVDEFDWAAMGLRVREVVELEPIDTFHMMGGTRLAARAEDGVVDPQGRAFGYRNLWVAGASVFPTGGIANPTFTACALTWLTVQDVLAGDPATAA
jgi:choline dehydrogenase-like flavoprotein